MCNRYAQTKKSLDHAKILAVRVVPEFSEVAGSYNVAPTRPSLVVRADADGPLRDILLFGLADRDGNPRFFNARLETAAKLPAFKEAWHQRRCLIPVDGWYEWKDAGDGKQPYYFQRDDAQPALLAGLWDKRGFCIVTMEAQELSTYHDRRPIALAEAEAKIWLQNQPMKSDDLAQAAFPAARIAVHPVARTVNKTGTEGPNLIAPITLPEPKKGPQQTELWG